jgi:hypothetical protein
MSEEEQQPVSGKPTTWKAAVKAEITDSLGQAGFDAAGQLGVLIFEKMEGYMEGAFEAGRDQALEGDEVRFSHWWNTHA